MRFTYFVKTNWVVDIAGRIKTMKIVKKLVNPFVFYAVAITLLQKGTHTHNQKTIKHSMVTENISYTEANNKNEKTMQSQSKIKIIVLISQAILKNHAVTNILKLAAIRVFRRTQKHLIKS